MTRTLLLSLLSLCIAAPVAQAADSVVRPVRFSTAAELSSTFSVDIQKIAKNLTPVQPSVHPSGQSSAQNPSQASTQSSAQSSGQPSVQSSAQPSDQASGQPSGHSAAVPKAEQPSAAQADPEKPTSARKDTGSNVAFSEVDGTVWLNSTMAEKLSFLLGVENAIAMEFALDEALAAQDGQEPVLSPFQEGWMVAFGDTPRQQIVGDVDAFYLSNPSQKKRHVFDVIWTEMISPAMTKEK